MQSSQRPVDLLVFGAHPGALRGLRQHLGERLDGSIRGYRVTAKTVGARDGKPELADGTVLDVASIVWATGYQPDYGLVNAPVMGADGWPAETRGVSD